MPIIKAPKDYTADKVIGLFSKKVEAFLENYVDRDSMLVTLLDEDHSFDL
jgi:hypothetical protein